MRSKRGSASVFLVFILAAMIGLTSAFIYAAKRASAISYGDGLLNLAGRSVLSEFALELKDRYGLFAFEKTGKEVEAEIKEDTDYALYKKKGLAATEIRVDFSEQSLREPEKLKAQILEYMKFVIAQDLLSPKKNGEGGQGGKERTLRNRKIIDSLPSAPLKNSSPGIVQRITEIKDQIGSIDQIFDQTKDTYLLDRYILLKFKNEQDKQLDYDTFFINEVEYILEGDFSNEENRREVRKSLVVLRSSFNAVHLYTDAEKRALTLAAAEAITPGPQAVLTQAILIGTWAWAEAENDMKLLDRGKPVVLFKDKDTWATDLESILENREEDCIDTGSKRGLYYRDYLMILLHFESEQLKLARVMDLIQINMKGTFQKDFLLKNYNCGFRLKAEIGGRKCVYDTMY